MMAVIFVQRFVIKVSDGIVNFCQDEIKAILGHLSIANFCRLG